MKERRIESRRAAPVREDGEFVASFEKGLRVVRAFDAEHAVMTLSQVAEKSKLTRAAARRFLRTLVDLGYASFDGKYFGLTARILELGSAYLRSLRLPEIVAPILRRVSAKLDESSSVAVLDDVDIVYVAREQTRRIISVDLGVGARLPAIYTSMGRVLLAEWTTRDRDALLARATRERHTRHTKVTLDELRGAIDEARTRGYALVDQELEEGLRSIAVPIRDVHGRAIAAMNVGGQANRVSLETMRRTFLPALLEAAQEIGARIR